MQNKYEASIKGMHNNISEFRKETKTDLLKSQPKYTFGKIMKEHITHYEELSINSSNVFCFSIDYDTEILDTNEASGGKNIEEDSNGNTYKNEFDKTETAISDTK
jgi:hypothetical protein